MWELDLADIGCLVSHNDWHRCLLNAVDTFYKYNYSMPIRSKTDEAVASAIRSILGRNVGRNNGVANGQGQGDCKRHVNLHDGEGIEVRVCRNPDVKCSIVERFNRTLKSKLCRWFTRNTYRYMDVVEKYITGYDAMTPALGWPRC